MKGFVYIIRNGSGKLYVGSTDDLNRRFKQHKNGHTQTTRNMGEIELIFTQEFETLGVARKIERKLKKLKRKDFIEKIVADGYIRIAE